MKPQSNPRGLILPLVLCALAMTLTSTPARAVGTRQFVLDSLETLEGGDVAGVSIASDGKVLAGWTLNATPVPDASSVWCSLVLPDGSVLIGTASDGKIYRVSKGKVSVAVETGEMGVSALALGWDGAVLAGTFPGGKLFRFAANVPDGTKPQAWVSLKETEDVWALSFDAKAKVAYAATGPEGRLFRIDKDGKSEIYFDSDESHLVSLWLDTDGTLYAGSNGKALLYKITGPGRASVVYDFDGDDVKAIAVVPKTHVIYAIANSYSSMQKGLPPPRSATMGVMGAVGGMPSMPNTRPSMAGKGVLYRFDSRGVAERMMGHDDMHYVALALDDQGAPYVGTGAEGRVYTVDDNHVVRLMADTEERQVGTIVAAGARRILVSSDPVVVHEVTGVGGAEAVWTSKALDAGLRAKFGLLEWRADGQLELQTRTGNTDKPDKSWSDWSKALTAPGRIDSPAARYFQVRARWARDPKAVLNDVKISFVTDNVRALLTQVSVGESSSDSSSGSRIPESGGPPDDHSNTIKLRWKIDNPDNDKLRYRVLYRRLDEKSWRTISDPNETVTKTDYAWDTTGVPEGRYLVRVDSSDELSNPPDRVTRHSLESRPFIVDNTPPVVTQLKLAGTKLQGTVTDGVSIIVRIEFSVVGSKVWYPIFPTDGVFDQTTENFDVDLAGQLPPGPQLVAVRAYDRAGNQVTRTVGTGAP